MSVYRPEAVSAQLADGSVISALCFNLPAPPAADERNSEYAAKLRELAERIGLPSSYVATIGIACTKSEQRPGPFTISIQLIDTTQSLPLPAASVTIRLPFRGDGQLQQLSLTIMISLRATIALLFSLHFARLKFFPL